MCIRDRFIADNEPNLTEKQKQIGGQIMKEIKNQMCIRDRNISHEGHRQRMRARVEQYGLESLAPHEALEYLSLIHI